MSGIYLDHAATTPMLENAIAAMDAQLRTLGNPSSLHTPGRHTRKDVEDAREVLAKELDRDFVDTDAAIERDTQKDIAHIFSDIFSRLENNNLFVLYLIL